MKKLILKRFLLALVVMGGVSVASTHATANDLPTAAGSPIAGISFDDRPLILPVQRNFQMAMLTASSELGRSCGRMEAYGWRLDNSEQDRVNVIFNNTVDRMRAQGYAVESKTTSSVAKDVTLFTADRVDRHLLFLWSAGEIGLAMVLCETSAPLSPVTQSMLRSEPASQAATLPSMPSMPSRAAASPRASAPVQLSVAGRPIHANFSPLGKWIGNYTCSQGTTGATLAVERIKGDQFEGTFSFYPTSKNPYVPRGSYAVFGEYDSDSQRILVNPGKWIDRPKEYFNTIMIGSFDPVGRTFSGYFQGITGCTSFEASHDATSSAHAAPAVEVKAPVLQKKPVVKKKKEKQHAEVKRQKLPSIAAPVVAVTPEPVAPPAVVATPAKTAKKTTPARRSEDLPRMVNGLETAAPEPSEQPSSVKGDFSIIGEPAKVPEHGTARNSSIDPPVGIVLGTGKK